MRGNSVPSGRAAVDGNRPGWVRPLLRFALIFVWVYALLLVPWPGLREGYGDAFRALGNLCLGTLGEDSEFDWRPFGTDGEFDSQTEVLISRPVAMPGVQRNLIINHHRKGYLPMAMLIAMVLATPMSLSRRLRCLALGVLLINVFVGFRILAKLTLWSCQKNEWALFEIAPSSRKALRFLVEGVYRRFLGTFFAPVFLWLALCVRQQQLRRFLGGKSER